MKRIMVSGCSGFLAHHFINEFHRRGWYVVGVDKRPIPPNHSNPDHFIQTNVTDLGFRDLMGIDQVYHLAFATNIPNSTRHPIETTAQNIDMTVHLLQYCKEAGVKKVMFPSTASLYGHNPTPWKEDMIGAPIDPYSWQKLSCEYLCQLYSRAYELPTVVFRFFQIFGEFQRDDTALAAFIKSVQEKRPITLTETTAQSSFKSGQRDFIYAGDVANAVCTVMETKTENGEVFNVCTGNVKTMEDVANALGAEIKWIPKRNWEVERHEGNCDKLKALNWSPKIDVINWLKQQI